MSFLSNMTSEGAKSDLYSWSHAMEIPLTLELDLTGSPQGWVLDPQQRFEWVPSRVLRGRNRKMWIGDTVVGTLGPLFHLLPTGTRLSTVMTRSLHDLKMDDAWRTSIRVIHAFWQGMPDPESDEGRLAIHVMRLFWERCEDASQGSTPQDHPLWATLAKLWTQSHINPDPKMRVTMSLKWGHHPEVPDSMRPWLRALVPPDDGSSGGEVPAGRLDVLTALAVTSVIPHYWETQSETYNAEGKQATTSHPRGSTIDWSNPDHTVPVSELTSDTHETVHMGSRSMLMVSLDKDSYQSYGQTTVPMSREGSRNYVKGLREMAQKPWMQWRGVSDILVQMHRGGYSVVVWPEAPSSTWPSPTRAWGAPLLTEAEQNWVKWQEWLDFLKTFTQHPTMPVANLPLRWVILRSTSAQNAVSPQVVEVVSVSVSEIWTRYAEWYRPQDGVPLLGHSSHYVPTPNQIAEGLTTFSHKDTAKDLKIVVRGALASAALWGHPLPPRVGSLARETYRRLVRLSDTDETRSLLKLSKKDSVTDALRLRQATTLYIWRKAEQSS